MGIGRTSGSILFCDPSIKQDRERKPREMLQGLGLWNDFLWEELPILILGLNTGLHTSRRRLVSTCAHNQEKKSCRDWHRWDLSIYLISLMCAHSTWFGKTGSPTFESARKGCRAHGGAVWGGRGFRKAVGRRLEHEYRPRLVLLLAPYQGRRRSQSGTTCSEFRGSATQNTLLTKVYVVNLGKPNASGFRNSTCRSSLGMEASQLLLAEALVIFWLPEELALFLEI